MVKKCLLIIALCFSVNCALFAQREVVLMNKGWKFHLGHASDIKKDFDYGSGVHLQFAKQEPAPYGGHGIPATLLNFNDSTWSDVTIPHDWSVALPYDFSQDKMIGSRYGYKALGREYPENSIGWYRKKFTVDKSDEGKQINVQFGGIFRDAMVWINGFLVDRHWSGHTGFMTNISDYIKYGAENVISVRVDASLHEGWFAEGAGINKEVSMIVTDNLHITHYAPQLSTIVDGDIANVKIINNICNESFEDKQFSVKYTISDNKGAVVAQKVTESLNLEQNNTLNLSSELNIDNPKLWAVDNPYLYTLKTELVGDGEVIDNFTSKFGVRTIQFTADRGFLLNGDKVDINGVCIHQTFGGVGSGISSSLHDYRIKELKKMGVNAIRSHYPFSQSMLEACDSLGMLVMQETRLSNSSKEAISQLEWIVKSHRNHPSIIIWSMANEEGGIQRDIIGKRTIKRLIECVYKHDSTRLTTAGVNAWGSPVDYGYSQEIDVMGFNYSTEYIDKYHKDHPNQPIIGTEVSNATTTRGAYTVSQDKSLKAVSDGLGGYYLPEDTENNYDNSAHLLSNVVERNKGAYDVVKFYKTRDYLSGSFMWTGFDYKGEIWPSTAENVSSQFGAIDIAGFPKAMYYYYKSWWTNTPVLHIAQHWNYEGLEGKPISVLIHSNCDHVKLFLNNKKVADKTIEKYGYMECTVNYKKGTLKAVGYKNGKVIITEQIATTKEPYKIELSAQNTELKANGEDVTIVQAVVKDEIGNIVPLADNLIEFQVGNGATIIGTANGDPFSHELDSSTSRKAFNGKVAVFIRSSDVVKAVTLKANSSDLKCGAITLDIVE